MSCARARPPLAPRTLPGGAPRRHVGAGGRVPRARPHGPHGPRRPVGDGARLEEAAVGDPPRPRADGGVGAVPRGAVRAV